MRHPDYLRSLFREIYRDIWDKAGAGDSQPGSTCEKEWEPPVDHGISLHRAFRAYKTAHTFTPGMIVTTKKDCPPPFAFEGSRLLAVVVDIAVDDPGYVDGPGAAGENVERNMRIGAFNGGTFCLYLVDPNYLEPYTSS